MQGLGYFQCIKMELIVPLDALFNKSCEWERKREKSGGKIKVAKLIRITDENISTGVTRINKNKSVPESN
jgi:hypothetical protein